MSAIARSGCDGSATCPARCAVKRYGLRGCVGCAKGWRSANGWWLRSWVAGRLKGTESNTERSGELGMRTWIPSHALSGPVYLSYPAELGHEGVRTQGSLKNIAHRL